MIAAILASIVATSPGKIGEVFTIPRQFWGEYNVKLADCGSGRNDSRLVIERSTFHFYESNGELREMISIGGNAIVALADFSGEGDHWTEMNQFSLSKDRKVLVMKVPRSANKDQSEFVRYRCPDGR
jgi:hypothetical protein